ncbi:hypothetical protein [Ectopseudomonas chengduensis]|jgi:hypothetical protein|uniref:hypothetical protein n=1 Tax=Ectopseudomonas chengduensis TaxID=489632 RepID=UPI0011144C86|nr:hypothetical protein [Pseudomonas chengduensis]MBP3063679.1 hypothetical protein [Pseudomonas chengduensis]NNB73442.1 hypothetical protein [Pseudomonas chengduensis]
MIRLSQGFTAFGITLELTACISPEACESASGQPVAAQSSEGSPGETSALDLQQLLAAMQPALGLALQGLQQNLVEQALVSLQKQVDAERERGR